MNGYTLTLALVAIIFSSFTIRAWMKHYYRAQQRDFEHEIVDKDLALEEMQRLARKFEDRIRSLELILDQDIPDWRKRL